MNAYDRNPSLRDAVYGAAVGDALGVPFEFMQRDTFTCVDMQTGGAHNQPAGTFSDDTSMMLATCDSIRERGEIDVQDMRQKFNDWYRGGAYTADGTVFDVGNTVASALNQGQGCSGERSNGNGSLMRIAPLAYLPATDDDVRAVSAITHAHSVSTESCVCFVKLLRGLIDGGTLQDVLPDCVPEGKLFAFLTDVVTSPRDEIGSGGFVLHTLGAAIWCFANTDNYADCVRVAVNLGSDSDTTACVAGALAGAVYGYDAIPAEWIAALRGKDVIEACLFA